MKEKLKEMRKQAENSAFFDPTDFDRGYLAAVDEIEKYLETDYERRND